MTRCKLVASLVALAVLASLPLAAATAKPKPAGKAAGPLDGKKFDIKVGQEGKPQNDDMLTFEENMFSSDKLTPLGFAKVKYTAAKAKGSDWTFTAELHSTKEGKTSWKGNIKGDTIGGIMIWNKEGQAPIKYVFTGMLAH